MTASIPDLITLLSTLVAVAAAVAAVFVVRRGADADLKGDVNELTRLVDRIDREYRREKMRRVRAGEKINSEGPESPPELQEGPDKFGVQCAIPFESKEALRRRLGAMRRNV